MDHPHTPDGCLYCAPSPSAFWPISAHERHQRQGLEIMFSRGERGRCSTGAHLAPGIEGTLWEICWVRGTVPLQRIRTIFQSELAATFHWGIEIRPRDKNLPKQLHHLNRKRNFYGTYEVVDYDPDGALHSAYKISPIAEFGAEWLPLVRYLLDTSDHSHSVNCAVWVIVALSRLASLSAITNVTQEKVNQIADKYLAKSQKADWKEICMFHSDSITTKRNVADLPEWVKSALTQDQLDQLQNLVEQTAHISFR